MRDLPIGKRQRMVLLALEEHGSWTDYDGTWGPFPRNAMRDILYCLLRRGLVTRGVDSEGAPRWTLVTLPGVESRS